MGASWPGLMGHASAAFPKFSLWAECKALLGDRGHGQRNRPPQPGRRLPDAVSKGLPQTTPAFRLQRGKVLRRALCLPDFHIREGRGSLRKFHCRRGHGRAGKLPGGYP